MTKELKMEKRKSECTETTTQIFTIVCQITNFLRAVETPQMQIQISNMGKTTTSLFLR
jgi:hypothetical protein